MTKKQYNNVPQSFTWSPMHAGRKLHKLQKKICTKKAGEHHLDGVLQLQLPVQVLHMDQAHLAVCIAVHLDLMIKSMADNGATQSGCRVRRVYLGGQCSSLVNQQQTNMQLWRRKDLFNEFFCKFNLLWSALALQLGHHL